MQPVQLFLGHHAYRDVLFPGQYTQLIDFLTSRFSGKENPFNRSTGLHCLQDRLPAGNQRRFFRSFQFFAHFRSCTFKIAATDIASEISPFSTIRTAFSKGILLNCNTSVSSGLASFFSKPVARKTRLCSSETELDKSISSNTFQSAAISPVSSHNSLLAAVNESSSRGPPPSGISQLYFFKG